MVKNVLRILKNKMVNHLVLICVSIVDSQVTRFYPQMGYVPELKQVQVGAQLMNDVILYDEERDNVVSISTEHG